MQVDVFLNLEGTRHALGRLTDEEGGIAFQYASGFLQSGLEVSPFGMPASSVVRHLPRNVFEGLPGFVADSLPDAWGGFLLDQYLQRHQRCLRTMSPIERLCWGGSGGMGALEYEPATDIEDCELDDIRLELLAHDVADLLESRSQEAVSRLKSLGGSAGGSRPKIVCLVSSDFERLTPGTLARGDMTPWILKFPGPRDPCDQAVREYVTSLITRRAGIRMPRTHLFTAGGCSWFGIERFDRNRNGKVHMCTAAALLECDFRIPCLDYTHVLALTARLTSAADVREQFRRAAFNYSIGNCDDHAKNFAFLMDAQGRWSVSPAYDLVTSPALGAEHMTSVCGLGKGVERGDFLELASRFRIGRSEATAILDEVADAVAGYGALAKAFDVGVPQGVRPI